MQKLKRAVSVLLVAILLLAALPAATQAGAYDYTGLTQGQINIVKRARQLVEIKWTPQQDIYQWNYQGVFKAGATYTGIPYGQPVYGSYVGFDASLSEFLKAAQDSSSKLYSEYSYYNKIAPYYSADCSGFVSYAWGLEFRQTTRTIDAVANRVEGQNIGSFQVGDALNKAGVHVVLITEVSKNAAGEVVAVEIMEGISPTAKATRYGQGGSRTLSQLASSYFDNGYVLYRYPERYGVTYEHDCAVPIDGDSCSKCTSGQVTPSPAPNVSTPAPPAISSSAVSGGVKVTLSCADADAEIYYTTNGKTPTASSRLYSLPFTVRETITIKAAAFKNGEQCGEPAEYSFTLSRAGKPEATVSGTISDDGRILAGSTVELKSATPDATICYTTNGSSPTPASKRYEGPISLTKNTTIKAIAFADGMSQSVLASFEYKVGDFHVITAEAGDGGSIVPSGTTGAGKAESKDFSITPDEGYKIADVTVDGVSVGAVQSLGFDSVDSSHTITVEFKSIELPFTDVKKDSWCRGAVEYVYDNDLMSGTADTLFSPALPMSRAMFVTVLGRLAAVDVDAETAYSGELRDLSKGKYYTAYVQWAYACGIVSGDESSNFGADTAVTREQICVMLCKYAESLEFELPELCDRTEFNDDEDISAYAREAVYALQQAGVISGLETGSFDPRGSASRAQVAQMFMRFATVLTGAEEAA